MSAWGRCPCSLVYPPRGPPPASRALGVVERFVEFESSRVASAGRWWEREFSPVVSRVVATSTSQRILSLKKETK